MIRPRITEEAGLKTLVIAEAGVNHNGDLKLAHQLIDVAADAGADLVKFQTFSTDRLVTSPASKADYQVETTDAGESQHAMLRRLELTRDMHEALIAHCKARRIQFFSTGFDAQSIDLLVELGVSSLEDTLRGDHQFALLASRWTIRQACDPFHRHGDPG